MLRLLTHIRIFTFQIHQINATGKKPENKFSIKTAFNVDSISNTDIVFILLIPDAENNNAVHSIRYRYGIPQDQAGCN